MHNECVRFAHLIKIVRKADTTIMHYAFCILH